MKKIIVLFSIILATIEVSSQTIYSKSFGDSSNEPLIYLHGGPGYNSIGFEISTAKRLSESGFYVIVYDRRGEGRSADKNAKFTFQETYEDLDAIYNKYNLENATLIGHSFGGVIGTLYRRRVLKK